MLEINNLIVEVDGKEIIKNLNLVIKEGEVHAIMGPNGSGKSTLSHTLAGKSNYTVKSGEINYLGEDLLSLKPDERAKKGLFLAFQYPVEIPGLTNMTFLKSALNAQKVGRGEKTLDAIDFLELIKEKTNLLSVNEEMLKRPINCGFSGGEKKRNEVLQMLLLEPSFSILDETDSGLDIDALKIVSSGVNHLRNPKRSFMLITHYQRILDHIIPDFVHILHNGAIVESGTSDLAKVIEKKGYKDFIKK